LYHIVLYRIVVQRTASTCTKFLGVIPITDQLPNHRKLTTANKLHKSIQKS